MAGIIGARQGTPHQGIAPNVELYGVKVFSETFGGGTTTDLISGIDWAIENDIDIINLSLGFVEEVPAVHDAIKNAYNQGILIVAASGNGGTKDGTGEQIEYPAKYAEVIAVASVDQDLNRSEFSAVGPENELAAPGDAIGGLARGNTYIGMSGTSQASPHVTGVAALLMQKYPQLSTEEIRELLIEKSVSLGSEEGRDRLYGYGLVQYAVIEPPVIEYNGDFEIHIEYGVDFEFPTATVIHEREELDVTFKLFNEAGEEISKEDFSTEAPGTYTLQFYAEDSLGQQADVVEVTLYVQPYIDTEPPVIHYDGEMELELEHGAEFIVPTVTVTDNVDEDLEATVTIYNEDGQVVNQSDIDTTVPAIYQVEYKVADQSGNEAELTIIITVLAPLDEEPPVDEGEAEPPVDEGEAKPPVDEGEAEPPVDEGEAEPPVDEGEAEPPVEDKDEKGNPPVIEYSGELEIIIGFGEDFEFPTATVSHETEELDVTTSLFDESGREVSETLFSTEVPGIYTLRFTAEDSYGQQAEAVEVTLIVQSEPPVIIYHGESRELEIGYGAKFVLPDISVVDYDLDISVTIYDEDGQIVDENDIDTTKPAVYLVEYIVVNRFGVESKLTITITVLEKGEGEHGNWPEKPIPPVGDGDNDNKVEQFAFVTVQPEVNEGAAVISDAVIDSVADNGTLLIDLHSASTDLSRLQLTENQVSELISRGIRIILSKKDVQLTIPAGVFKQGDAAIHIERVGSDNDIDYIEQAKSAVYQFTLVQNGEKVHQFEEPIELRFLINEEEEATNLKVYYWNGKTGDWEEIGGSLKDGYIVAETNHFSIFSVFSAMTFEEDESDIEVDPETKKGNVINTETEEVELPHGKEGTLPNTATSLYHWLTLGLALIVVGFAFTALRRLRQNS